MHAPMLQHLLELRRRVIYLLISFGLIFSLCCIFATTLLQKILHPLLSVLPEDDNLIATGVMSPLFAPLKFAFDLSLIICAPIFLYQTWRFIAPGLYQHERRLFIILCVECNAGNLKNESLPKLLYL